MPLFRRRDIVENRVGPLIVEENIYIAGELFFFPHEKYIRFLFSAQRLCRCFQLPGLPCNIAVQYMFAGSQG